MKQDRLRLICIICGGRVFRGLTGLILASCLFLLALSARGEDDLAPYIQTYPGGSIDWDRGRITGVGRGYIHLNGGSKNRALRAAQAVALQSILKIASGIPLNDRDTLASFGGGRLAVQLRALIKYVDTETRLVTDEGKPYIRVARRASLRGVEGLTVNVLDHMKAALLPWNAFPDPSRSEDGEPGDAPETWLVVDARPLVSEGGVEPALFPKITDESGHILYDVRMTEAGALQERGMIRYVVSDLPSDRLQSGMIPDAFYPPDADRKTGGRRWADLFFFPRTAWAQDDGTKDKNEGRKNSRRRKRKAFVVKAKAAGGLKNTNLVISEKDAKALKKNDPSSRILKKCRVIVVVNSTLGGIEGVYPQGPDILARQ